MDSEELNFLVDTILQLKGSINDLSDNISNLAEQMKNNSKK